MATHYFGGSVLFSHRIVLNSFIVCIVEELLKKRFVVPFLRFCLKLVLTLFQWESEPNHVVGIRRIFKGEEFP